MPVYEYVCTACAYEFELTQKMSDAPRQRCPRCRRKVVRKVGSGAGIIFKGSGFYATDYRSPEYRAQEKAEKGAPGKAGDGKGGGEGTSGKGSGGSPAGPPSPPNHSKNRPESSGRGAGDGTKSAGRDSPTR